MGVRTETLVDLWQELLGPREGPLELIAEDPRSEYICGVLRPEPPARAPARLPDPDEDAPELSGADSAEDDDDDGVALGAAPLSPSIDPTLLPRSIGLSFVVAGAAPSFRICCTWARYLPDGDGAWRRVPDLLVTDLIDATAAQGSFAHEGVEIRVETSAAPGGRRVAVYLINALLQADPSRSTTAEHLFQAQIRVSLGDGTSLCALEGRALPDEDPDGEERRLELLYRGRQAFARGHMCGAVWRDIDPERHAGPAEGERPDQGPFRFTDAGLLGAAAADFSPADVRTEFLPIYPVEAPDSEWRHAGFGTPELTASRLAGIWEPADVESALRPLERAYAAWIDRQRREAALAAPRLRSAAARNIEESEELAARLNGAIALLMSDEDIRLAFCFANRAMALQGSWSRPQELVWRPFQLAFFLITLESAVRPDDRRREICDLLWFPTGGGKTEAYLALAAFVLAFRRLRGDAGGGTAVLSRYTLRLLTIQQFRRALSMITACEKLRVDGLATPGTPVGWRPRGCGREQSFLWGGERFSAGLWVGGGVTPNRIDRMEARIENALHLYLGAIEILQGARPNYRGPDASIARLVQGKRVHLGGEPAQVTNCPCCSAALALPDGEGAGEGMPAGDHIIYVPHTDEGDPVSAATLTPPAAGVTVRQIETGPLLDAWSTRVVISIAAGSSLGSQRFDEWWSDHVIPALGPGEMLCARPSRPGYSLVRKDGPASLVTGFEILCPNPDCELNRMGWAENVPVLRTARRLENISDRSYASAGHADLPSLSGYWQDPPLFHGRLSARVSGRMPIPGLTVDDQIYAHPPSLLVATADKFARLAYEPRAAGLFGNVAFYHARYGYYRAGAWPSDLGAVYRPHPPGGPGGHAQLHTDVPRFDPPDLVIQDELHLIEGPLGSIVGLYETAIDALAGADTLGTRLGPKYVASTATIRQAGPQVQALFNRAVAQFPPQGMDIDDSFFAVTAEPHPLDERAPGRLYVGVAAPGKGAQTPIVRIWSSLLQSAMETRHAPADQDPDRLWTLAAYFNAVRELAGAATLYRQDIPERIRHRYGNPRPTDEDGRMELSSRVDSMRLPAMLGALEIPGRIDVVSATSMFGTGVDINRLGLMVIHGQPKTTSTYIQATGRVGRRSGALVVTFLRAARPRDLDHYEFFNGYHRALYRHVEPITVSPFAPKARERCFGPVSVALLRQASEIAGSTVSADWSVEQRLAGQQTHSEARRMRDHRRDDEVEAAIEMFERRAATQPTDIRPAGGVCRIEAQAEIDAWHRLARLSANRNDFVYAEPAVARVPVRSVVLGDPQHLGAGLPQAYENAPQSLREIEETTTFKT